MEFSEIVSKSRLLIDSLSIPKILKISSHFFGITGCKSLAERAIASHDIESAFNPF